MKHKKTIALLLAGTLAASMMLGGCGNQGNDDIVATCGDQEFTLGYMNFLAHYYQLSYDSFYAYYYGDDYWTNEDYMDSDGRTMEESVKDSILEEVEYESLLEQNMADYGIEITDADREAMSAAAAEFMSDNSRKTIDALGASEEYVEELLYYQTVTSRMQDAIEGEVGEDIDIADYACRTFDYIVINLVEQDEDEDEEVLSSTNEMLWENAEMMAEDAAEDFDGVAETYNYTVYSYSYGADEPSEEDGGFCEAVIEEADSMSEDEVSGVIEGDGCLYIIHLTSEDDEDAAESAWEEARSEVKSEHLDEVLEGYKEGVEFTVDEKLWAKVTFYDLFYVDNTEE